MARKNPEGIESLRIKQDPVSIQEITMLDWFAGFALMGAVTFPEKTTSAKEAFDMAEEMLKERAKRI
jgi:hypothetical protein